MRVLHILAENESNRAANYAADVILGLQRTDIKQFAVIDRETPRLNELEKSGVKISSKILRAPLRRLWMQRLIARLQPDVTHCWSRNAAKLMPNGKKPVIGWLAGYDDPARMPRCTHFVSATRDSAHLLRAPFIPAFSESNTAAPLDRHVLATPRDVGVLLNSAPLHPDSNHEILMLALRNFPGCVLWLVGEGPYRRVLERKARDMEIYDRVRFATSGINRAALLRAADICVLTAADRPFGTLVPQTWAANTPVIVSRQNDLSVPVEDNLNGLLVQAGDPAALSLAVRRLLDDKSLRGRLAAKGYAAYLGKYAHEAIIRQWMDFYRQLAAG